MKVNLNMIPSTKYNPEIPGISLELNHAIGALLQYDNFVEYQKSFICNVIPEWATKAAVEATIRLESLGVIDEDGNFCDPATVEGEAKIILEWVHENI